MLRIAAVQRFEDVGRALLVRVRAIRRWRVRDEGDRRRVGLALTSEGERLLKRVRARRTTWLAERLRGLDDEELEGFERAIEPLGKLL